MRKNLDGMSRKVSFFGKVIKRQENNNKNKRTRKEGQKEIKMLVWKVAGLEEKNEKNGIT